MRRKRAQAPEEDEPKVDISSLIDVCFLLLIYFIVTSTITEPESDLVLKLPSDNSKSDKKPDIDPVLFVIADDGSISQGNDDGSQTQLAGAGDANCLHRKPSDMPELNNAISNYKAIAGDRAIVQVRATKAVKAQHVIDLLNVLAKHNIKQITFTKLPK